MNLIYENDDVYCTYKAKGVHTLQSANSADDASLCLYRLDKCTSGILVFAKSKDAYDFLKMLQQKGEIKKLYRATTETEFDKDVPYVISTYFRPYGVGRKKVMCVKEGERGKYRNKDVTKDLYTTRIVNKDRKELYCEIEKGFRHQIRAHLAYSGFPIEGDTLYNGEDKASDSIALECMQVVIQGLKISL